MGRREFIQFICPGHSPSLNQAGTLAPNQSRTHGRMLLATQWLVLSELSYTAQDHRPREHTAQSSLGSTTSVNQNDLSQMEPQASLISAKPQLRFPLLGHSSLRHTDKEGPKTSGKYL